MDIKAKILDKINKKGKIKSSEIVKEIKFSREYINRHFQELRNEGKIILIGKGRGAYYVSADKKAFKEAKKQILQIKLNLENKNLSEDVVLKK